MSQVNRNQRLDIRIPAFEKHAYCLCLHVKPATIFIAVIKLMRALLFASIVINNEFTYSDPSSNNEAQLFTQNPPNYEFDTRRSTASGVTILILMMIASVSALGIYSVVSGKASLLMPLYAIMLCDFFFALPAFYNRDLDNTLADGIMDLKSYWPQPSQNTRYSLMLVSTIIMLIKIYFLCVIWKCYRYLRMQELLLPIHVHEIYPHHFAHQHHIPTSVHPNMRVLDANNTQNIAPPPYDSIVTTLKTQPPNYEEAMKSTGSLNPQSMEQEHAQQPPQNTTNEGTGSEENATSISSNHLAATSEDNQIVYQQSVVPSQEPTPLGGGDGVKNNHQPTSTATTNQNASQNN